MKCTVDSIFTRLTFAHIYGHMSIYVVICPYMGIYTYVCACSFILVQPLST